MLDTLIERDRQSSPFESAPADSAGARGLGERERLASGCRLLGYQADGRILAVVPDSTPERWMRPRLAWLVDTVASRFRTMRPELLSCTLAPSPD